MIDRGINPLASETARTAEDVIATFTPLQRKVYDNLIVDDRPCGETRAQIAARIGVTVNCMTVLLAKVRDRLGLNPPRGNPKHDVRGNRVTRKRCSVPATFHHEETTETPAQARERVRQELAAGQRCSRCWLILPCDHVLGIAA